MTVDEPTGAECSWPKQWQYGFSPGARLMLMPMMKSTSSPNAPSAQALPTERSRWV
jgi:hypothetical protein